MTMIFCLSCRLTILFIEDPLWFVSFCLDAWILHWKIDLNDMISVNRYHCWSFVCVRLFFFFFVFSCRQVYDTAPFCILNIHKYALITIHSRILKKTPYFSQLPTMDHGLWIIFGINFLEISVSIVHDSTLLALPCT